MAFHGKTVPLRGQNAKGKPRTLAKYHLNTPKSIESEAKKKMDPQVLNLPNLAVGTETHRPIVFKNTKRHYQNHEKHIKAYS